MEFNICDLEADWTTASPLIYFVRNPLFAKYGLECWQISLIREDNSTIKYNTSSNRCSIIGDRLYFGPIYPASRIRIIGSIDLLLFDTIATCNENQLAYYLTSPDLTSRTLASARLHEDFRVIKEKNT